MAAALGLALAPGLGNKPLLAHGAVAYDSDLDGLPDTQEALLGTSPLLRDSDFDGFSDSQEVLLGSSPVGQTSVPTASSVVSASVTPRYVGNKFHLLFALFAEDGNLADKTLAISLFRGGQFVNVDLDRLLPMATIGYASTADGGELMTIDVSFPPAVIVALQDSSWIARAGVEGHPGFLDLSVANMSVTQGIIIWERTGHLLPPTNASAGAAPQAQALFSVAREPIAPQNAIPTAWSPGQICLQQSMVIGADGPYLLTEVVSASCQSGWSSSCDPGGCAGTVGNVSAGPNPIAIIGG